MDAFSGRDRIADLQRQVFSRGASPDSETLEQLRAATAALDATKDFHASDDVTSAHALGEDHSSSFDVPEPPKASAGRIRYVAVGVGALALGVAAGLVIGNLGDLESPVLAQIGEPTGAAAPSGEAVVPAHTEEGEAVTESATKNEEPSPAFRTFAVPQMESDIFPLKPPAPILPETTRQIAMAGDAPGLDDNDVVYAALTSEGKPCLLVVTPLGEIAVVCVSRDEFFAEGLRLEWTSTTERADSPTTQSLQQHLFTFDWRANGDGEFQGQPMPAAVATTKTS